MPTDQPSTDVEPRHNGSIVSQAIRFSVVGAAALVIDVGGFNALRNLGSGPLHYHPISAKVISSIAGATASWLGNRHWTFRQTRRAKVRHELFVFALVSVIAIVISTACLAVSHYLLGFHTQLADNASGNGIGLILATLFRFWAYKHHVFVSDNNEPSPDTPDSRQTTQWPIV